MRPLIAKRLRAQLALAGGALTLGTGLLSGCAFHPDPTENNFYVRVLNDTSMAVILSTCGTGDPLCTKTYETGKLAPGKAWPSVQTSVDLVNPVLIRDLAGHRLGCLPLLFDYNASGLTVRVSEMTRCRRSYPERKKPG
jgi:hypothetical protein